MADRQDMGTESLSASVSHASEPVTTSWSVSQVLENSDDEYDEEEELERRRWSSETSHKSEEEDDDGWMVTPPSTVAGRRDMRVSSEVMMEEDEEDMEANVREALQLLEDYGDHEDGESEGEDEVEQWRTWQAKRGYVDFVHEMMEERWTLWDRDGQSTCHWRMSEGHMDSKEKEMEDDEDRHQEDNREKEKQVEHKETSEAGHKNRSKKEAEEKGQEDDWQEAYTAKGRVYYYSRRTRESSWKKPSQFNASSNQPQPAAAATEEESKLHRSVLQQSSEYHPSTSVSSVSNMERQTTLFCCFCGKPQPSDQLAAHFRDCKTAKLHKQRLSPLYLSFERALVLMSEDATLRSVHYASSFPDPTPHGRPGVTSMQESLLLLRPTRRLSSTRKLSSTEDTSQEQHDTQDHVFSISYGRSKESLDRRASQEVDPSLSRQALDIEGARRKKVGTIDNDFQSTDSAFVTEPVAQHTETCRYCSRSFAEGRLAKHEAVCPRVFAHEGSWARGTPSKQVSSPNVRSRARVRTPPRSAGSMTSNVHKLKDHTLQQSFNKHQATLVLCPCCRRKFAPSGAQQHIAICKGVQNRPKNPIPFLRNYAIVG